MFEPRPFGPHTLQRLHSSCNGNSVVSFAGLPTGCETQQCLIARLIPAVNGEVSGAGQLR